jgi:hypothetical protein
MVGSWHHRSPRGPYSGLASTSHPPRAVRPVARSAAARSTQLGDAITDPPQEPAWPGAGLAVAPPAR